LRAIWSSPIASRKSGLVDDRRTKLGKRIEVMLREITRMGVVLEELRNFTRPVGKLNVKRVPFAQLVGDVCALNEGLARERGTELELAAIAEQAADLVQESARAKHIVIELALDGAAAKGDARALEQVLVNLLDNAVRSRRSARANASGPRGSRALPRGGRNRARAVHRQAPGRGHGRGGAGAERARRRFDVLVHAAGRVAAGAARDSKPPPVYARRIPGGGSDGTGARPALRG
jgi:hypothetical protein